MTFNEIFPIVFASIIFFATGVYIGKIFTADYYKQEMLRKEEEEQKLKMWNDYLTAIKGEKNER